MAWLLVCLAPNSSGQLNIARHHRDPPGVDGTKVDRLYQRYKTSVLGQQDAVYGLGIHLKQINEVNFTGLLQRSDSMALKFKVLFKVRRDFANQSTKRRPANEELCCLLIPSAKDASVARALAASIAKAAIT